MISVHKFLLACRAKYLEQNPGRESWWLESVRPHLALRHALITEGKVAVRHKVVGSGEVFVSMKLALGAPSSFGPSSISTDLWPTPDETAVRLVNESAKGSIDVYKMLDVYTQLLLPGALARAREAHASAGPPSEKVRARAADVKDAIARRHRADFSDAALQALRNVPADELHALVDEAVARSVLES